MSAILLCEVEERFEIKGRGLILAPDFKFPETGKWENFTTTIEIEEEGGKRKEFEAYFGWIHLHYSDPTVPVDKRWRIALSLRRVGKDEVPIGSRVYISDADYKKLMGETEA